MPYKNKEDKKIQNREYYLKHKEHIRKRQAKTYNSEDNKRRCKEWREKHKVEQQTNPHKPKKLGKSPARNIELINQLDEDYIKKNDVTKKTNILTKSDLDYSYTQKEQDREFELLQKRPGDISSKQYPNKIVLSNQPHYYEVEKKLWNDNKNNLRSTLVLNRKKHLDNYKNEYELTDKDVLRGFKISGKHVGFTHFNPLWIRWFIEHYNVKSIYDPCGGWGHRLLGANKIEKYIYNDFDPRTVDGCKAIAKNHSITNAIFYNEDSSKFTAAEEYEAVFTCPPYYNIEKYNNKSFKDKEDYKTWWDNTVKCCLKEGVKYFAYIINHTHYDMLKEACESNGLMFLDKHQVGKALGHFSRSINNSKKVEYLVVFELGT